MNVVIMVACARYATCPAAWELAALHARVAVLEEQLAARDGQLEVAVAQLAARDAQLEAGLEQQRNGQWR